MGLILNYVKNTDQKRKHGMHSKNKTGYFQMHTIPGLFKKTILHKRIKYRQSFSRLLTELEALFHNSHIIKGS